MSTKSIGITLIVLGALIMIFSRLMEVTIGDSGIVNINLLSEKQNTLIFGGLIFLAGIILYAAFKSKQTKEEETIEELKSKEKSNLIINRLKNIFSHQEGNTGPIKNRLLRIRGLFMDSSEGWKSIFLKLLIGFFFGIMAATNLWFIVYRWFRSQRGAPFLENIDSWTYTDNSYYFLFVLIILIAIKNGTISSSFKFTLLASMPIILSGWALRIYIFPPDDFKIIHLFTPLIFP